MLIKKFTILMHSFLISVLFFGYADNELFSKIDQFDISRNKLLKTFSVFPKEYEITFEVNLSALLNTYSRACECANLFCFTTSILKGCDGSDYGNRMLAVFITKAGYLYFESSINKITQAQQKYPITLGLSKFNLSQLLFQGSYVSNLKIDDKSVYSTTNTDAREFNNVNMYFSDSLYDAQPGYARNLLVTQRCSESNFYCQPQLNVQLDWLINENLLNTSFQITYNKSEEYAYNVVWEYFFPIFVTLQSDIIPIGALKVNSNSLKYTISKLQKNGINHKIIATINNTKCLFGEFYTIDIPVQLYFENDKANSWKSFRAIRKIFKENCKSPVVPAEENQAREYYGRGVYWDDIKSHIYLCMNQYVTKVHESACYFSQDNGLCWQAMDVRIGAVLGHDVSNRILYAVHRNQKLYLMFHDIFKKWLAVSNNDFEINVLHKLNWTRLKSFVGVLDVNVTFNTDQWMGNENGFYFKNLTDNTWVRRFKWNV